MYFFHNYCIEINEHKKLEKIRNPVRDRQKRYQQSRSWGIDDQEKEKARDIFFYDVPKYWKEDDVVRNLSKIGKVLRIQIKQQYKYKSVRVQIILEDRYEKAFRENFFGVTLDSTRLRWYDAIGGLKGRRERDQWQLIRDLTDEEMKRIHNHYGEHSLVKEIWQSSGAAYIKILKITQNWKVITYFANQKEMEAAVQKSILECVGEKEVIWMVRNAKTIFRSGKQGKESNQQKKEGVKEDEKDRGPTTLELKEKPSDDSPPITPPERIYLKLGNYHSEQPL